MIDKLDPYSQSIQDLASDPEFAARWPYVKPRMANLLIKGQLVYAKENADPEEVGRFTQFTLRILELMDKMDPPAQIPHQKITRPRLTTQKQ